ncbi:hypothetical protein G6F57_005133 [Rhizopus arrhizus]|uniref:Uncharacterized protein n=1 Tax=Rhizopus oryzae TaxID=64495 RepID=A0A9P6XBR1_RHIOR|nr:hypothetical protein G6F23_008418 [Rhizopus arrhizus]KAG0789180.1 hypothetical protein G6F22_006786 [Rhizopus arrhizus]KAG0814228.1 hypothetical protein G6F20_004936 [Rhizopus arrhizus]KAG0834485.1 hypothetical protein G6F19_005178 [Rhizopus arrhizus]KAG0872217.1 hypothetical protein G6F16_005332 [Rhizopus arrhizus]
MQKEIERNLNLRNEIRHRIITADNKDKKKFIVEGLKYLVPEKDNVSLSASTSNSAILSTVMKRDIHQVIHEEDQQQQQQQQQQQPKAPLLSPASFLTGFSGFSSDGLNMGGNFITRGISSRTFSSLGSNRSSEPSISTRFFQRLTSRLEDYEKKIA